MKPFSSKLGSSRVRFTPSIETVLGVSWWIVLFATLALLTLDGFVFYNYGIRLPETPRRYESNEDGVFDAGLVRRAANIIKERNLEFQNQSGAAPNLPDPFR